MARMIFALKDNKMVDIDSVENGLACGCACIACGASLIARNNGVVREHHFAHYGCDEHSECYNKTIVTVTNEMIKNTGKISLPYLSVTVGNERKDVVKNGSVFEYFDVEVIQRKQAKNGGFYTLLVLSDKKGNKLELIVSCGVKNNGEYTITESDNSRLEITLDSVEVLKMEDLNKILADGILNMKWVYNRKADSIRKEWQKKKEFIVENDTVGTRKFYKKTNSAYDNSFKRRDDTSDSQTIKELKIKIQEKGIKENLPQGRCPYCGNTLKVFGDVEFDVLRCNICSFKAEMDRSKSTVSFTKKFGDRTKVVLPIPKMFLI